MSTTTRAEPRDAHGDEMYQHLVRHLEDHREPHVNDLDLSPPARMRLLRRSECRNSRIYCFEVASATSIRRLLVKVPFVRGNRKPIRDPARTRPRLYSRADPQTKAYLEHLTLCHIDRHFATFEDSRFETLRPIAYLPRKLALVLPEIRQPTLQQLLKKANRLQSPFDPLGPKQAFRNAGAWLRRWHQCSPLGHTESRHVTRDQFLETTLAFCDFIDRHQPRHRFLRTLGRQIEETAQAVLPTNLPVGLSHSDFAPCNIFVGSRHQVTVFDTVGRWQTAVFEDMGRFLLGTKTPRAQVHSQGLLYGPAVLRQFERAFLDGYFDGEPIPLRAVRLYELQALVARWCAVLHASRQSLGVRQLAKRVRRLTVDAFFARYARRLMTAIQTVHPAETSSNRNDDIRTH